MSNELAARQVMDISGIESQVSTAHKYPRDAQKALKNSHDIATMSEDIAASMYYKKPVGKDEDGNQSYAEGPSVRLAEVIASQWGNLRVATQIADVGDATITVQAYAHDLESNYQSAATVTRRIINKYGKRYGESQVQVTIDAASAIARRNAIFQVVPRAIADQIFIAAKKVAVGDAKRIADRRDGAIAFFKKLGIDQAQILKKLNRERVADIDAEDVATLIGLWQAIKDKEITVDAAFGEETEKPQSAAEKAAGKFAEKPTTAEKKPSQAKPLAEKTETKNEDELL